MMRQVCYALLALVLIALAVPFGLQSIAGRSPPLPVVQLPPELAGRSCEQVLEKARELIKQAPERARPAYLWLLAHCDGSPLLPGVMLEAGSLFGHLLQQPDVARQIYGEFLRRFASHPEADAALYQLAKLDLDDRDYTAATAHLTELEQRFPNSSHRESAAFLASKATEMLVAEHHWLWTFPGQVAALVPNNFLSFVVIMAALGPAAITFILSIRTEGNRKDRWVLPTLALGLTLLNYGINNLQAARHNAALMKKLDRLMGSAQSQRSR